MWRHASAAAAVHCPENIATSHVVHLLQGDRVHHRALDAVSQAILHRVQHNVQYCRAEHSEVPLGFYRYSCESALCAYLSTHILSQVAALRAVPIPLEHHRGACD